MSKVGKYRLVAELGRGGMADVFLAVTEGTANVNFNKLVVLKRMRERWLRDPDFVAMFMDEARLAARLNHPNVVQTLEVERDGDELVLAMEYLDGQPLHRVLARARATLPLEVHLSILHGVLNGIDYAHNLTDFDGSPLNVVHRDVTPHNIFVTYDGQVKVVDFGIATAEGRASQTKHGVVKGKVAYMAPEQAKRERLDRRTDVFAVGVMLYEACTRDRMWGDASESHILRSLILGKVPRAADHPLVPESLAPIIDRALSPYVDRFASALDLQLALEDYMDQSIRRPSARQVGSLIADLFEDRRKMTKQIIESQLADLKGAQLKLVAIPTGSSEDSDAVSVEVDVETGEHDPPSMNLARPQVRVSEGGSDDTSAAPQKSADIPLFTRRRVLALAGVIGIALGALAAFVLSRRPGAVAPSRASSVRLSLRTSPVAAKLSLDGVELANPYDGSLTLDSRERLLHVSAEGFQTKEYRLVLSEDTTMHVALERVR
jgi:serine/threonine-protein kinase